MLLPSGNPFECHEEVLYLQPMIPPKRFDIFYLDWGMLRRSRRVQLFLSKNSTGTICIAWLHLQEGHFIFICFAPLHVHPCPCNVRISTEYLYSEHALKVRWMHSYPTAGKINPNHAPKSLCCCSTVQERLRSV